MSSKATTTSRKRPSAKDGTSTTTTNTNNNNKKPRVQVQLAADADSVLAKCRALKATLRAKKLKEQEAASNTTSSSINNGNSSDSSSSDVDSINKIAAVAAKKPSGSSSNNIVPKQDIVEVDELSATEVVEGMEGIALQITQQILQKRGFTMDIPSRAASNQIYVPEWDRIVLGPKRTSRTFLNVRESRKSAITLRVMQLIHAVLVKRIHITKRDLFYTDVKLFVDQAESDGVLDDVATMIGCTRSNLHVVASDKGLVVGRIQFEEDGDPIDCTRMGVGGKAIPPYIDKIENIRSDAEFILLVEKEAAYMRMAEDRFYHKYPCIVITAKGQPDVATRMFLARITNQLQIPVLGLVDSDPYGLKILSVYMSGSKNMSYDSASLTTPDIMWLGLRPSDLNKYDLPDQCRLDMTENDIKTGKELMTEDFIQKNPKWMKELEIMVKTKKKAEIQALSSFGFQYITEEYLPRKLKEGDWI
jgi:meiotic recombination protein SPO11